MAPSPLSVGPARSDLGLLSRGELTRLAWLPPHALLRSFMSAESDISLSSAIMASWARPGDCKEEGLRASEPSAGGRARLMIEFLLEYSDRSVMGVRLGSRLTTLPLLERITPEGPKYPPFAYSKRFCALRAAPLPLLLDTDELEAW
jgi:hypothetical protein